MSVLEREGGHRTKRKGKDEAGFPLVLPARPTKSAHGLAEMTQGAKESHVLCPMGSILVGHRQ